jgi:hypothetical protein
MRMGGTLCTGQSLPVTCGHTCRAGVRCVPTPLEGAAPDHGVPGEGGWEEGTKAGQVNRCIVVACTLQLGAWTLAGRSPPHYLLSIYNGRSHRTSLIDTRQPASLCLTLPEFTCCACLGNNP